MAILCQVAFPGTLTHITFTKSFGGRVMSAIFTKEVKGKLISRDSPKPLKQGVIKCRFILVLAGSHRILYEYKRGKKNAIHGNLKTDLISKTT